MEALKKIWRTQVRSSEDQMFQWNGPEAEDSSSEDLQEVGSEDPSYSSSDVQKFWGTCSEAEVARSEEYKL